MIRISLCLFAGVIVGGVIHLSTILAMPRLSSEKAWDIVTAQVAPNTMLVISENNRALAARLGLDPAFVHAICPVDLTHGPVAFTGHLPAGFWTASLTGKNGNVVYSTTSRTSVETDFNVAMFHTSQTRLRAAGTLALGGNVSVISVKNNALLAVVRVLPPHRAQADIFSETLARLECGTIATAS